MRERSTGVLIRGIGIRLKQRDHPRILPAGFADRAGFAELRLFGGGPGIGILDTHRQGSGVEQRVGERLGVQAVGLDADREPGHLFR